MSEKNKKYGLGVAALLVVLGLVAVLVSTSTPEVETDELLGSPEDGAVTIDEIGPPPSLIIDPEISLSGSLTPDGNFYQFERNEGLPDEDDLDATASREEWTALVFDDEYDSIEEFLNKNTTVTNQLSLVVVWDANQQDWDVYPNEIFRSDYDLDTLDIFDDEFEGTVLFNTSRAYEYIDHTEDRSGDFDAERGWNYGPKPDFDSIEDKAVIFWEGDVTGNADRLTDSGDLNDAIDRDFYDDLDDDESYWFFVKGTVTDSCDDEEALVCGVDGNTYQNSCKADSEDVDVDYVGQCKSDRTALIGELEEDTLSTTDKLVLEFFESSSDTTPETLDMDESEIDLDDNDTDFAIFKKDGARFEFISAFSSSDVDVRSRSIEIDLDGNLDAGEYELRIFDTFEREKVREVELDFEVEAADPGEGPALVLASEDEEASPADRIDFDSVNNELFDRSADFNNDKEIVKVYKCENTSCSNRTDITGLSNLDYSRLNQKGKFSFIKTDGFEAGKYEVEIENGGFVYSDGRIVKGKTYEFEVVLDLESVNYTLQSVTGSIAILEPDNVVSEISESEALGSFELFEDDQLVDASEYTISYDNITKEVAIELIGRTYLDTVDYKVEVTEELNLLEEWEIEDATIEFNGPQQITYGPALTLESGDDSVNPNEVVNLLTGVAGEKIELVSGVSISDAINIFQCSSLIEICTDRVEINGATVAIAADGLSVDVSNLGFPDGGIRFEVVVNADSLQYENGDRVTGEVYSSQIPEQG